MTTRFKKQARSPYHRKGKAPFRYSDLYREWSNVVRKTGTTLNERALELDAAFRIREGLPPRVLDMG